MRPKSLVFRLSLGLALWLILAGSGSAFAGQPRALGRERPDVVAKWKERLKEVDTSLRAGEWKKARRTVDYLLTEMCDRIEKGEGARALLGLAVLGRAIAQAGLGNEHDALWDFGIATYMMPEFANADLSAYGAAGEFLLASIPAPSSPKANSQVSSKPMVVGNIAGSVSKPVKRRAPNPKYPYAKRNACMDGLIIVQFEIDRQGLPLKPKILSSTDPVLAFAALDGVRDWAFEPALLDGEPVVVYYNLSINFALPPCRNPFARARED